MLCHSGSPVLADSSKCEKHFQEDFKHPRLFSPSSILPIPWKGEMCSSSPDPLQLGCSGEAPREQGCGRKRCRLACCTFLRRSRKTPKPPKNSPCSLGKGTETTAGPVHPVLKDMGAGGRVPAAAGVSRDLFTRTKNDPGAPSPGEAVGEEGPAVPVGLEQQVPSVSVSLVGIGHALPAPAFSQKHSRSCPCSWSCWPLAWPVPYKGEGARAMLVTVPLCQGCHLLQGAQNWKGAKPGPCLGGGGCGSGLGGCQGPWGIWLQRHQLPREHRTNKKHISELGKCPLPVQGWGTEALPGSGGLSVTAQLYRTCPVPPCAPVSSTEKGQGMRQNLLGMGTESMAHGPHGPSGGVPHCLWDSAQGCRGRAGQGKDILVWECPCPHPAGHGSGTDPTDTQPQVPQETPSPCSPMAAFQGSLQRLPPLPNLPL